MKKFSLVLLLIAFTLQVNASVVVRSNIIAYADDATIAQTVKANIETETEKQERAISETIADIKKKLKPMGTPKENLELVTDEAITESKSVILGEAKGTKKLTMESETMAEVKKEQKNNETFVVLKTEKGDIKIKLYMEKAPITACNFLDLAKKKFYNGLTFHRLISGFMIQGGCPLGTGTGNYVDPETNKPRYIKHETHPELKHDKEGVVAMARTSDPDSASSQFFIDLGPQPFLDAGGADPYGYAIFGQVVDGMSVVHKIMNENVAPYPGSDGTSNPVKIETVEIIE